MQTAARRLRTRLRLLNQLTRELQARCDALRATAEQLRRGEIHPSHAANRITKIANEIAGGKR